MHTHAQSLHNDKDPCQHMHLLLNVLEELGLDLQQVRVALIHGLQLQCRTYGEEKEAQSVTKGRLTAIGCPTFQNSNTWARSQ